MGCAAWLCRCLGAVGCMVAASYLRRRPPDRSPRSTPEDQARIAQHGQLYEIGFAGGGFNWKFAPGGHGTECFPRQIMPLEGSALAQLFSRGSQRAQANKKGRKKKRGLRRQPGCPGALALAEGHLTRRERGNPSPQGEGAPQTPRPEGGRKDGQTNRPHTPRTTHSGNERGRGPRGDKTNRPHATRGPPTNEPHTSEPKAKRFGAVRRSCGSI